MNYCVVQVKSDLIGNLNQVNFVGTFMTELGRSSQLITINARNPLVLMNIHGPHFALKQKIITKPAETAL